MPHGSVRRRMAFYRPASSPAHGRRTPQAAGLKGDPRRRLLRPKEGLPLAHAGAGLSALEDRLRLVQEMAHRRHLGATKCRAAGASTVPPCGRHPKPSAGIVDSQSVKTTGVGGNERGFDPAKRWEAESVIS